MDYRLTEGFEFFGWQPPKVGNSPQVPATSPSAMRQGDAAARLPLKMFGRQPVQYEEPVHRAVKPPFPGSSTPRLPAQTKIHPANDMTTIPIQQDQLDPKKFPELIWPWRWAYVPSNTTTDPSARVLVPINHETQAIHPSYYRRFPSAVANTSTLSQLQSISVGESATSSHKSDPTKNKKDSSSKSAHPIYDEFCLPNCPKESFQERFNVLLNSVSTSKPPSSAGGLLRLPGAHTHTDTSARLNARMETLRKIRQQTCSDKELNEFPANKDKEQRSKSSEELRKRTMQERQRLEFDTRKMEDARNAAAGTLSDEDIAFTLLYPGVPLPSVPAQPASKSANQIAEENLKRALSLPAAGRTPTQATREKNITAQMVDVQKNTEAQTIKNIDRGIQESRKRLLGAPRTQSTPEKNTLAQAVNAQNKGSKTTYIDVPRKIAAEAGKTPPVDNIITHFEYEMEENHAAQADTKQTASNTKREGWLAIDKPKTPQEGFEQLNLDSDEEGWEKVDGDDEWQIVDDPEH